MTYFRIFFSIQKLCIPKIVVVGIFLFITVIAIQKFLSPISAVGKLENLADLVSTREDYAENVEHRISFELPYNAEQISTTDYVIVDMSNFADVTIATSVTGSYIGTPVITLDSSSIKITGIVVVPGAGLIINGITADNPGPPLGEKSVTVIVSEDSSGAIIKNIGTTQINTAGGSVTVTATVDPPVASLVITGYSAPGTFVTFTENGSVIGTDSAGGSSGFFSQVFTGLNPGDHSIKIYGVDQSGRATSPVFLDVTTPIYQQTTIGDILLPPTVNLSATSIAQGDDLVVYGTAVPSGDLTVFTESPLRTYSTTVDTAGDWNYTITNTNSYNPGDYRAYSLVLSSPLQSIVSTSLGFSVGATGITPTPAGCNISTGDLNCDSSINIMDFSILMYYWGTTQPAGDVNSDGNVNLTDFSILMYYWGT